MVVNPFILNDPSFKVFKLHCNLYQVPRMPPRVIYCSTNETAREALRVFMSSGSMSPGMRNDPSFQSIMELCKMWANQINTPIDKTLMAMPGRLTELYATFLYLKIQNKHVYGDPLPLFYSVQLFYVRARSVTKAELAYLHLSSPHVSIYDTEVCNPDFLDHAQIVDFSYSVNKFDLTVTHSTTKWATPPSGLLFINITTTTFIFNFLCL